MNKLHFKIYSNRSSYFKQLKYFTILLLLLYFGSKKCRLGEQKRIIKHDKAFCSKTFDW